VNSEGTVTRFGKTTYSVQLSSSAQAADGMRLTGSRRSSVARLEELPTRDALMAKQRKMLETVGRFAGKRQSLRRNIAGRCVSPPMRRTTSWRPLIGQNVLGQKPQLGKPNRRRGAFATSYKTRVLPNFLSVVDDPTLKVFQGKSPWWEVTRWTAEGVKAKAVNAIENGMLANYLIGRQPIRDCSTSNGHGRAAPGNFPGPSLGVLLGEEFRGGNRPKS